VTSPPRQHSRSRSVARDLTAPATLAFKISRPSGNTTVNYPDASITNPSVGVYRFSYITNDLNDQGRWTVRAEGTGNGVTTAKEATFDVEQSPF